MLNLTAAVQLTALFSANITFSDEWRTFVGTYNKTYKDINEEYSKYQTFQSNQQMIAAHNAMYDAQKVAYKLRINHYSDKTEDEMMYQPGEPRKMTKKQKRKLRKIIRSRDELSTLYIPNILKILPDSVDWRDKGLVTDVKDQNLCGSCWAFSVIGSIEGQLAKKKKTLVSLSEQQMVDCGNSSHYMLNGCGGGSLAMGFLFAKDHGATASDADYPYTGKKGECRRNITKVARIKSFKRVWFIERALKHAIANVGPISAVIFASGPIFHYSEGIYYDPNCNKTEYAHAVLIVGYGSDGPDQDFYWIKNSWGTDWGMSGYMKFARNRDNHCSIAEGAYFPVL